MASQFMQALLMMCFNLCFTNIVHRCFSEYGTTALSVGTKNFAFSDIIMAQYSEIINNSKLGP